MSTDTQESKTEYDQQRTEFGSNAKEKGDIELIADCVEARQEDVLPDFSVRIPKFLKIKRGNFEANSTERTIIHEPLFKFKDIVVAFNYYKVSGKITFMLLDSAINEYSHLYNENLNSSVLSAEKYTMLNIPIYKSVSDLPLDHGILYYFLEKLENRHHDARYRTILSTNNLANFLELQELIYSLPFEHRPYLVNLFIRCYRDMTFKLSRCRNYIICEPCDFEKNVDKHESISSYLTNISHLIDQKKKSCDQNLSDSAQQTFGLADQPFVAQQTFGLADQNLKDSAQFPSGELDPNEESCSDVEGQVEKKNSAAVLEQNFFQKIVTRVSHLLTSTVYGSD